MQPTPTSYKSTRFQLVECNGPCLTGYFIRHLGARVDTPWDTGCEGAENLKQLKKAYRKSRALFNSLCAEYFTEGATVFKTLPEGEFMGHIINGYFVKD